MPSRSLITILSFLLWISLSRASFSGDVVTDTDGEPLVPGQEYYITSAIVGKAGAGGVKPVKTGNASSCSYSIIQERFDVFRGTPVKFRVVGSSTDMIYLGSTNLEIEFVEKPDCAESSKWAVVYDSTLSSPRLVIGGPQDHPDSTFVNGVFQIQFLLSFAYKLVFCPQVINIGPRCHDIGVAGINWNLVLRDDNSGNTASMLMFPKAESVQGKLSII